MSAQIEVQQKPEPVVHVDADSLAALAHWVQSVQNVEEIAWNSDRFKQIRDWLREHKTAKELRIRAVRVEMIALRRVAQAGLTSKLTTSQDRSAAEWAADLPDAEFEEMLSALEKVVTPYGFMRLYKGEKENVRSWLADSSHRGGVRVDETGEPVTQWRDESAVGLIFEVNDILDAQGAESFTVAGISDELRSRLVEYLGDIGVPSDPLMEVIAGEPLREVVRAVLRAPQPGQMVRVAGAGELPVPKWVTYTDEGGVGERRRIAWGGASILQFKAMCAEREKQASDLVRRAARLRAVADAMERSIPLAKSERCADLIAYVNVESVEVAA